MKIDIIEVTRKRTIQIVQFEPDVMEVKMTISPSKNVEDDIEHATTILEKKLREWERRMRG
jgi:hypothetical protein